MTRLALFASGHGTNAISILENLPSTLRVEFLLSDNPQAPILEKIKQYNIPVYVVPKNSTRHIHEQEIFKLTQKHQIDWICLAGYMRILSPDFLKKFKRVVNIHPSLLPAYPGTDSILRAFNDHVSESGVTLHHVDQGIDTGPIIYQEKVPRLASDTFEDFKQRIHLKEYEIYKKFLQDIADVKNHDGK